MLGVLIFPLSRSSGQTSLMKCSLRGLSSVYNQFLLRVCDHSSLEKLPNQYYMELSAVVFFIDTDLTFFTVTYYFQYADALQFYNVSRRLSMRPTQEELEERNILKSKFLRANSVFIAILFFEKIFMLCFVHSELIYSIK